MSTRVAEIDSKGMMREYLNLCSLSLYEISGELYNCQLTCVNLSSLLVSMCHFWAIYPGNKNIIYILYIESSCQICYNVASNMLDSLVQCTVYTISLVKWMNTTEKTWQKVYWYLSMQSSGFCITYWVTSWMISMQNQLQVPCKWHLHWNE